ncbi:MAG: mechanosensitive ion channel family protein [Coleofasciculaceae cyanobacterium]
MQTYLIKTWLFPLVLILAFILFGIIFEKVLFNRLNKLIDKFGFPGSQFILLSLQRTPTLVFLLIGIYGAISMMPIDPKLSAILQKILIAVSLFTIFLVLAKLTAGFVRLSSQRIEGLSVSLLSNLAQIFVLTLGLLITLQTLGIEITPIIATLGIGGLAVALAFQDTFSNLLSGLYLIISRQVKRGDYIKLASGEEGYVHDITWRNTTIREIPNNIIIVPNNKLSSAIFKNYHLPFKEIIIQIPVGVSYESNLEEVEEITLEVAQTVMQTVDGGVPDFEPFIRYQSFEDFRISLIVYLRVNEFFDQRLVKHEFIKQLHSRYREKEIEIPFPTRTVHFKNKE